MTTSTRGVAIAAPARGTDIRVRVTAPTFGEALPVVLFSGGFGFSMDGYGPLVDHWAESGFVVVQPTHLDAAVRGLAPDDPRTPHIWRHRIEDLRLVLDHLPDVLGAVPGLATRVDQERIGVAGHSYGATTASALLGARVSAPAGDPDEDFTDPRVRGGVLIALAGLAGDELTPMARQFFPFMSPTFDHFAAPALLVAGGADQSVLSTRGPDWWTDGFQHAPGGKDLVTVAGADHVFGGIHAHGGMPMSPSDDPAVVSLVQRTTTAWLQAVLTGDAAAWTTEQAALAAADAPAATVLHR